MWLPYTDTVVSVTSSPHTGWLAPATAPPAAAATRPLVDLLCALRYAAYLIPI
jgi:hypothetical protein